MKSFVMAMFLLTTAFGSALGIALSPTAKDPKLVWMYTGLCIATIIVAAVFWLLFRQYNATEEQMNALEDKGDKPVAATDLSAGGRVAPGVRSTSHDVGDDDAQVGRAHYTEGKV